jgi:hypothetical protein
MSKIRKLLGKPIIIKPIVDQRIYDKENSSFCGNSLSDSNVLVLTNNERWISDIELRAKNEKCCIKSVCIETTDRITENNIFEYAKYNVGPFQHIINFYKVDNKSFDICETIYENLKIETDYLKKSLLVGTICTVIVYDTEIDNLTKGMIAAVDSLIKGLGIVLPAHDIISNGIISPNTVPLGNIIDTTIFLSGKFGHMLTGEVITFDN